MTILELETAIAVADRIGDADEVSRLKAELSGKVVTPDMVVTPVHEDAS